MIAYLVPLMQYWDKLILRDLGRESAGLIGGPGMGFLPVFATEAEAAAKFPGVQCMPIVLPDLPVRPEVARG